FDQHLWVETEAAHMLSGLGFSLWRLASVAEECKRLPHTLPRFRRISMSRSHCRKDHQRVEVFLDGLARLGDPESRQLRPYGLPPPQLAGLPDEIKKRVLMMPDEFQHLRTQTGEVSGEILKVKVVFLPFFLHLTGKHRLCLCDGLPVRQVVLKGIP